MYTSPLPEPFVAASSAQSLLPGRAYPDSSRQTYYLDSSTALGSSAIDGRSSGYVTAQPISVDSSSASITHYVPSIYSGGSSNMVWDLGSVTAQQQRPQGQYILQDDGVFRTRNVSQSAGLPHHHGATSVSSTDHIYTTSSLQGPSLTAACAQPGFVLMQPPATASAPANWLPYETYVQPAALPQGQGPGPSDLNLGAYQTASVSDLHQEAGGQQWVSPKVVDGQVVGYDVMPAPNNPVPVTPATSMTASLYVKNLPPDMTELVLYQKFAPFGALLSCKVPRDSEGKCKGVGFVNFVDRKSAILAMTHLHGTRISEKRHMHVTLQVSRMGANAHVPAPSRSPGSGSKSAGPSSGSGSGAFARGSAMTLAAGTAPQVAAASAALQTAALRLVQRNSGGGGADAGLLGAALGSWPQGNVPTHNTLPISPGTNVFPFPPPYNNNSN